MIGHRSGYCGTRTLLGVLAGAALLAGGCAGDSDDRASPTSVTTTAASSSTTAPPVASQTTTPASSSTANAGHPREHVGLVYRVVPQDDFRRWVIARPDGPIVPDLEEKGGAVVGDPSAPPPIHAVARVATPAASSCG